MAKNSQKRTVKPRGRRAARDARVPLAVGVVIAALVIGGVVMALSRGGDQPPSAAESARSGAAPKAPAQTPVTPPGGAAPARDPNDPSVELMETSKAVMVTVELDFGGTIPPIQDALKEIDRKYEPLDGQGRTFAVLDAYGQPTPDGKLHLSMHVSSEKPGMGSLVFRRTGEVLWKSRIVQGPPATSPYAGKQLVITLEENANSAPPLDVSNGATDVLDSIVSTKGVKVRDFWRDGEEREVTFFYSTCGCPVKVKARRAGERVVRTSEMPLLFPDDPQAMVTINGFFKWKPVV
jgi:hypothetical protein